MRSEMFDRKKSENERQRDTIETAIEKSIQSVRFFIRCHNSVGCNILAQVDMRRDDVSTVQIEKKKVVDGAPLPHISCVRCIKYTVIQ